MGRLGRLVGCVWLRDTGGSRHFLHRRGLAGDIVGGWDTADVSGAPGHVWGFGESTPPGGLSAEWSRIQEHTPS